jgi:hypothetical protein
MSKPLRPPPTVCSWTQTIMTCTRTNARGIESWGPLSKALGGFLRAIHRRRHAHIAFDFYYFTPSTYFCLEEWTHVSRPESRVQPPRFGDLNGSHIRMFVR